jgi:hypothetical protein
MLSFAIRDVGRLDFFFDELVKVDAREPWVSLDFGWSLLATPDSFRRLKWCTVREGKITYVFY